MIRRPIAEEGREQEQLPVINLTRLGIRPEEEAVVEKVVKDLARQGLEIRIVK